MRQWISTCLLVLLKQSRAESFEFVSSQSAPAFVCLHMSISILAWDYLSQTCHYRVYSTWFLQSALYLLHSFYSVNPNGGGLLNLAWVGGHNMPAPSRSSQNTVKKQNSLVEKVRAHCAPLHQLRWVKSYILFHYLSGFCAPMSNRVISVYVHTWSLQIKSLNQHA